MEFSKIIKKARKKVFKFPRTFFSSVSLSCGYTYYLQIERGEKIPSALLAVELLEALGCEIKSGLYAWVRDQLEAEEHKAMFGIPTHQLENRKKQKESLIINRMQAKLLQKAPVYWDIITFINSYSRVFNPDTQRIANEIKLPIEEVEKILHELWEYGLIDKVEANCFTTKFWVFIPYDQEFMPLRDYNFNRAYQRFWTSPPETRFRTTQNCLVTATQKEQILQYIMSLLETISSIPECNEGVSFTLGIFASERNFEPL